MFCDRKEETTSSEATTAEHLAPKLDKSESLLLTRSRDLPQTADNNATRTVDLDIRSDKAGSEKFVKVPKHYTTRTPPPALPASLTTFEMTVNRRCRLNCVKDVRGWSEGTGETRSTGWYLNEVDRAASGWICSDTDYDSDLDE